MDDVERRLRKSSDEDKELEKIEDDIRRRFKKISV